MRRRHFIWLVGGAAAWPAVARAQQADQIRRVGALMSGIETDAEQKARWDSFRKSLEGLGWLEGRNVHIEVRFAGGRSSKFESLAKEMVALQQDIIFVHSTGFVAAVARQTRTIPIVFANVSDPIGAGFVGSLARPGANLTGLVLLESSIAGKWLSMLKEMAPALKRAILVGNPKTSPYDYFLRTTQAAAPALGIDVLSNRVENVGELESSLETFARDPDGGLVVVPDSTMTRLRGELIGLAARHRLPAVYPERFYATDGGLMTYGIADLNEPFRQAASYVDRILRGAKPGDLPVQGPTKYSTILNLKTAKALGLTVPPAMLVRADEVIE
jgi:putative ABC transport system substrate-binding protein